MALNFERVSVLFVDDNPIIRSIMHGAFKILGVGCVLVASDGAEAIEFLKLTQTDPNRVGTAMVDVVVSNWDMSPVDGMLLLRFIRRHKDSPDRFMPFLFLTAYTELDRVQEARNLGAHEVISKPFTIQTVGEKLLQVINKNRQFVHSKDYFGPDRRRQVLPCKGPDRRVLTDKSPEVEIVHG